MTRGSPKRFGVGVIGYSIGRVHAHAWKGLDEAYHPPAAHADLVALAGRTRERVESEAERFGYKRFYTDWRKLVADEKVDIVDVCAPPFLHADASIAAADAGKSVICEKPMARTSKEAKTMVDAVKKAKVHNMVGYNYRFTPAVALAKQMIEEGLLGRLYYYRGSYLNTAAGYIDPETPFDWHHSRETGAYGALGDLGTHAIDMARFLAGEISSVQASSKTFIDSRPERRGSKKRKRVDVDDVTVSTLNFANGALGVLEAAWLTPGRLDYLAFEAYGSKGSVRFNLERINELAVHLEGDDPRFKAPRDLLVLGKEHPFMTKYWVNQAGGFSWEDTFTNELNHYLERLVAGRNVSPEAATFEDGYRNCLVMDAVMESSSTGRRVSVGT